MWRLLTIAVVLFGSLANAANWYVDSAKIGNSANNGTAWSSAWTNFSSINWGSVSAGDIVYLSGAPGGTSVYTGNLDISKSGTFANRVTVKASQESGHNGFVLISGSVNFAGEYITFDGAKDDSATNLFTYTWAVTNLDNWINIQCGGVNVNSGNGKGEVMRWLIITNQNADLYHAIKFNPDPGYLTNSLVEYVHVNRCGEDGVQISSNQATDYDALIVRWCWIDKPGDDGLESNAGTTVHNCVISSGQFLRGHPDAIQASGNFHRLYNNVFYDFGSSLILMQGQAPEGGAYGFIQIYGNEFYYKAYPYPGFNVQTTELEYKWYPADTTWNRTNVYYTNWVIANNTFAFLSAGGQAWEARSGFPGGSQTGWVSNAIPRNIKMVNNLFWKVTNSWAGMPYGKVGHFDSTDGWTTNTWSWSEQDVEFNYNFFATNGSGSSVSWMGTNFTTGEQLSQHYYKSNWSLGIPQLTDPANYDLRPLASSSNLVARGTNLAGMNLPGWGVDLYGVARSSTPSLGASEPSDNGMLVWLTFDDDFSDSRVNDFSGRGNHAYRFGKVGSLYPSNSPTQVLVTSEPGRSGAPASDKAGRFGWFSDGYGLYGRSGQYVAITNVAPFLNVTQLTCGSWSRWFHYSSNSSAVDYTADISACIVSAGDSSGTTNSWEYGRDPNNSFLNNIRLVVNTNGGGFGKSYMEFNAGNWISSGGNSTNWIHTMWTFNAGLFVGYINGVPVWTNNLGGLVPKLTVGSYSYANPRWIGIGVKTHDGDPWLNDEPTSAPDADPNNDYPNNGWMHGLIDDVRIYSRALSAAEVAAVFAGGSGVSGSGGGGVDPGPPAVTNSYFRIRSFRFR